MGKLIVPRHTADLDYIIPALKIYYDSKDWVDNTTYKDKLVASLINSGKESERNSDETHYTKCSEISRYFGFLERAEPGKASSDVKITESGISFYEAYMNGDISAIQEIIIKALETVVFGRNNEGCGSDVDCEAPNVVVVSALLLDGITNKEAAYILSEFIKDTNFSEILLSVKYNRLYGDKLKEPTITSDIKFIPFLKRIGFMEDANGGLTVVKQDVIKRFRKRLEALPLTNTVDSDGLHEEEESNTEIIYQGRQIIYYGAPGTGKSFEIKEQTKGKSVIRTTFHPDSDYSTFVGAYKPTMEEEETKVVPVVVKNGISLESEGTYKEKKIVYKFIPQAFLKAYLGAWKKYADRAIRTSLPWVHTFKNKDGEYTITGVNTNDISFHRVFPFDISHKSMERVWNEIWSTGSFVMPTGAQSGASVQQAIAQWIYDNVQNCMKQSLDEGLESLKKNIEETGQVSVSKGPQQAQTYTLSKKENGYFIDTDGKCSKTTIQNYFDGNQPESGARELHGFFAKLLQEIDSSDFEKAWSLLADAISKNKGEIDLQKEVSVLEPQFLVIEEINRGNCAQIFGDLFQLLDRGDNGFSEYPIEADTDLQQEIERAFKEEYKLNNDINIEGEIKGYTSNYGATLSQDVQSGRVLLLPNNLYIWATMNTSDQSLFPIDSAFKRRWDWKYIKIKNYPENNYQIVVGEETPIPWWSFVEKINDIIASMTSSADKQLGYFFCKADKNGNISAETFVSKVIFYLWNDVFKDYGFEDASLFRYIDEEDGKEKDLTFPDFYGEDGEEVNVVRLKDFIDKVMNWKQNKEEQK